MSHSYSTNQIHLVFSTKDRKKCISPELQLKLWPYMAGIARNHGFEAIKIGGVEDHAHALLLIPPKIPLAKTAVISYIANQPAHHLKQNYVEEFLELLMRYGIAYDPEHLLG